MLTASIYDNEALELYADYISSAILMTNYAITYQDLDLDWAITFCKNKNILPILGINRIMHPQDMDNVIEFIKKYQNQNVLFYVSDLGILEYAKENNISNLFIYNPETMITNGLDLRLYNDSFNPNAIGMSLEITILDFIHATKDFNGSLFYQIFGTHLMFYSNRKLISLYENKNNTKYPHDSLYLREVTRNDLFPVLENEYGTQIYRSYQICYLKYLSQLNLKYEYIETLYIDKKTMVLILKAIKDFKSDNDLDKAMNIINSLGITIKDGFSLKDSVYQKEELKL